MRFKASPLFSFDKKLSSKFSKNFKSRCLVGIDEAGRGPWAGPVIASAVVLPPDFYDSALNDSKKLTARTRMRLCEKIMKSALWAIAQSDVHLIDDINILQATHCAMERAFRNLLARYPRLVPGLVAIDGRPVPGFGFPQKSIVRGDTKSAAIAAASILAKVHRDKMMLTLDRIYPHYGFAKHKGYGTALHREKLFTYGPSPVHRSSFSPVRAALGLTENAGN